MDWLLTAVIALGAFGIGGLLIWISRTARIHALASRLGPLEAELAVLRGTRAEADTLRRANLDLEKQVSAAAARVEGAAALETEIARLRQRLTESEAEKSALGATLDGAAKAHADQVRQLCELRQSIQDQFKLLAGDALKTSNEDFAKRAEDIFKTQKELTGKEIDQRSAALAELIKPLGESLKAYDVALKDIEKARIEGFTAINTTLQAVTVQSGEVRTVAASLVNALRASPKTRGRWGEETLRRVMELSGMVEHCDFETEKHFSGDDESLRPDALISVAGGRSIVVDAKAPISAYLDAVNSVSDAERETLLKLHAAQLRERLKNLSSKSYWEKIAGSTDCVVMFVPGDNFVSAAFERDPDLFEDGIKNRVLICTPTTFIALAKAISYGWRQEKLAANALDVARLGRELYQRLSTMTDHVSVVGKHLRDGVGAYNKLVGSLEGRVLPQARRFHELGVEGTAGEIDELPQIDVVVRPLASDPALEAPPASGDTAKS
ncbi:MAG TPA: DNA recombination protein RmuC [Rhizomicrobium sp.]